MTISFFIEYCTSTIVIDFLGNYSENVITGAYGIAISI